MKYSNNNETGFKNVVNEDAQLESEEIEVDIDQLEQRAMKEREKELIEKKVGSKGDLPKPEKNQEESKENEVKASNPPGKSNEANEAENENLDIEIKL